MLHQVIVWNCIFGCCALNACRNHLVVPVSILDSNLVLSDWAAERVRSKPFESSMAALWVKAGCCLYHRGRLVAPLHHWTRLGHEAAVLGGQHGRHDRGASLEAAAWGNYWSEWSLDRFALWLWDPGGIRLWWQSFWWSVIDWHYRRLWAWILSWTQLSVAEYSPWARYYFYLSGNGLLAYWRSYDLLLRQVLHELRCNRHCIYLCREASLWHLDRWCCCGNESIWEWLYRHYSLLNWRWKLSYSCSWWRRDNCLCWCCNYYVTRIRFRTHFSVELATILTGH